MREHELSYFEEILLSRKTQILKNISGVEHEINQLREQELKDDADLASAANDNIIENAIGMQQTQELREIEIALQKIKNKSYGICEMCEDEIGFQRLKVKPHARYCIVCRPIVENKRG